jgi:hypothetical protein
MCSTKQAKRKQSKVKQSEQSETKRIKGSKVYVSCCKLADIYRVPGLMSVFRPGVICDAQ